MQDSIRFAKKITIVSGFTSTNLSRPNVDTGVQAINSTEDCWNKFFRKKVNSRITGNGHLPKVRTFGFVWLCGIAYIARSNLF